MRGHLVGHRNEILAIRRQCGDKTAFVAFISVKEPGRIVNALRVAQPPKNPRGSRLESRTKRETIFHGAGKLVKAATDHR